MLPFIWLPSQVMLYLTIIKKYNKMTQEQFTAKLSQKSPFLKDYEFYNLKKGDKVSVLHDYHNTKHNCTFIKYEIVELKTGFVIPFGPKNFKKAHKIVSVVEYINTYNIKEKWRINKEGYTELIEVI